MKSFTTVLFILIFCPLCFLGGVDVYVELKSVGKKMSIAIEDITAGKTEYSVVDIISNDLEFSGLFDVFSDSFTPGISKEFDFTRQDKVTAEMNGIETVVKASISVKENQMTAVCYCWDVISAKKIFDKTYKEKISGQRNLAHSISEDIIQYLTGRSASMNSKIAFVVQSRSGKEIWCSDYDGGNPRRIISQGSISMLPKFSASGESVYYTTYKDGNPDLFKYDFKTSKSVPAITYQGINIACSFSQDGKYFIAALSKTGDTELYLCSVSGKIIKRLTFSTGIDVGASFAPNSREFVFVSNRSGNPNLFIMDIDGGNLRRITSGGYNDSPCWSPVGDKIVYSKKTGNIFDIYVFDVTTFEEKRLTYSAGSNENPYYSPDGRHIIFSSNRRGVWEIYVMPQDGSEQIPVKGLPKNSTTPVWSR